MRALLRARKLIACGLCIGIHAGIGSAEEVPLERLRKLAPDVARVFATGDAARRYEVIVRLDPLLLQGDFNGDGRIDAAVVVAERASGKVGIAIVHSGGRAAIVLGAGRNFGNGGDDFRWMDAWRLYPRGRVGRGAGERSPPALRGDALLVEKTESASALVYWTGKGYAWYQQGD